MARWVKNPIYCLWGCGFDPWPHSVGYGSGIATSYSIGHRCGSDLALLWFQCRPVGAAPIWPLARELPYATGVAVNKKRKRNKKVSVNDWLSIFFKSFPWGCLFFLSGPNPFHPYYMLPPTNQTQAWCNTDQRVLWFIKSTPHLPWSFLYSVPPYHLPIVRTVEYDSKNVVFKGQSLLVFCHIVTDWLQTAQAPWFPVTLQSGQTDRSLGRSNHKNWHSFHATDMLAAVHD